jgi:hypothetical protein
MKGAISRETWKHVKSAFVTGLVYHSEITVMNFNNGSGKLPTITKIKQTVEESMTRAKNWKD